MDFKKLKANSGQKSLDQLTAELSKIKTGNNQQERTDDDRFWSPTVDKVGNGYAVIRFLPAPPDEDVPFVKYFDHGFQGPTGQWYIEKSLTSLGSGHADPVSEYNSKLWSTGLESDKETVRRQKRRLHFISNIYVVTDQGNPENEGKVFLFKYGKKIYDKLSEAAYPEFPGEVPFNPFDFWNGANFRLKIRNVEGYRNYDKSEFESPSPLFNEDKLLEEVWKKEYPIQPFVDESSFKSYKELKERLDRVLGLSIVSQNYPNAVNELPWADEKPAPVFKSRKAAEEMVEEDEESLEFFKKLASNQ